MHWFTSSWWIPIQDSIGFRVLVCGDRINYRVFSSLHRRTFVAVPVISVRSHGSNKWRNFMTILLMKLKPNGGPVPSLARRNSRKSPIRIRIIREVRWLRAGGVLIRPDCSGCVRELVVWIIEYREGVIEQITGGVTHGCSHYYCT